MREREKEMNRQTEKEMEILTEVPAQCELNIFYFYTILHK